MYNHTLKFSDFEKLDLDPIFNKIRLTHSLQLTELQLQILQVWYKRFLFLFKKYSHKPLAVCKMIDFVWHEHILDTKKYYADCTKLFGELLHHNPYAGIYSKVNKKRLQQIFAETDSLMLLEFGESMSENFLLQLSYNLDNAMLEPSLCSSECEGGNSQGED